MRHQEVIKSQARVSVLLLFLSVAGCTTTTPNMTKYDATLSAPLSPDEARVCFVRQSSMLGAIVTHYVFDCGTGIAFDSTLIEESQIRISSTKRILINGKDVSAFTLTQTQAPMRANSDKMNYAYVALSGQTHQGGHAPNGLAFTGENYIWLIPSPWSPGGDWFYRHNNEMGHRLRSDSFGEESQERLVSGEEAIQYLATTIARNAKYIGSARSGANIVFDRPEGIMRLKVVTEAGDEAFAPDFTVEKGKKYVVAYSYGLSGVRFTISERP